MKLELDYDNKTIKIIDFANCEKFIEVIVELPKWKEWKIIPNSNMEYIPYPYYPTYTLSTSCEITTANGVYIIEAK